MLAAARPGPDHEPLRRLLQQGSLVATLEHELLAEADFASRATAGHAIFEFTYWYNGERRHPALGYVSPARCEHALAEGKRAA